MLFTVESDLVGTKVLKHRRLRSELEAVVWGLFLAEHEVAFVFYFALVLQGNVRRLNALQRFLRAELVFFGDLDGLWRIEDHVALTGILGT